MNTNWHDLYSDGIRLEYILKQLMKKYKKATKDNEPMAIVYAESIRKITHEKVDIAKTVLGVEQIIKDKKREANIRSYSK